MREAIKPMIIERKRDWTSRWFNIISTFRKIFQTIEILSQVTGYKNFETTSPLQTESFWMKTWRKKLNLLLLKQWSFKIEINEYFWHQRKKLFRQFFSQKNTAFGWELVRKKWIYGYGQTWVRSSKYVCSDCWNTTILIAFSGLFGRSIRTPMQLLK